MPKSATQNGSRKARKAQTRGPAPRARVQVLEPRTRASQSGGVIGVSYEQLFRELLEDQQARGRAVIYDYQYYGPDDPLPL